MKKMLFTLITMLTIAASASAMPYEQARSEALFLTDKMAYELNLSDAQYEAAYEINLDYLMGVTSYDDVLGIYWERRNLDLSYILYQWQWDLFRAATYFYRPLYWEAGHWHFGIYMRYPHRDYFYFGRPHFFATYRGGHSWRHNGGHSYYESRHHDFRPNHSRDQHIGMRNHWDNGDYRNRSGHSSTRITGRGNHDMGRNRDTDRHQNNPNTDSRDFRRHNDNRDFDRSNTNTGNREMGNHGTNTGNREIENRNNNTGRGDFDRRNTNTGRGDFNRSNTNTGRGDFNRSNTNTGNRNIGNNRSTESNRSLGTGGRDHGSFNNNTRSSGSRGSMGNNRSGGGRR